MAETSDELEPDSLLQKHRTRLTSHRKALCSLMSPIEVIVQLRRQGVFTVFDQEKILSDNSSDLERNGAILDELFLRGPDAFHELVRCLRCFREKYSSITDILQPVVHRILWFATNPTHAAAVVHALECYHNVKFPPLPRNFSSKNKYIVRRAIVFFKWIQVNPSDDNEDAFDCVDNVELCLIFPISERSDRVTETLVSAFDECPQPTVAVMSGVCDGDKDEVVVAKSLVTSASRIDLAHNLVEIVQQAIQSRFVPSAKFIKKFTESHGFSPPAPIVSHIDAKPSSPSVSDIMYKFYETCQQKLSGDTPYLACVGTVERDCPDKRRLSYSLLTCLTLIEICSVLMDNSGFRI